MIVNNKKQKQKQKGITTMSNINEIKKLLTGKGNNSFVFRGKAVEEIWGCPCIAGRAKSHYNLVEMVDEMPPCFEGYVLSDGQLSAVSKGDACDVYGDGSLVAPLVWQNIGKVN